MIARHQTHLEKKPTSFNFQLKLKLSLLLPLFTNAQKVQTKHSAKARAEHSWGRCVLVLSCLNHFKQHNTLAVCSQSHLVSTAALERIAYWFFSKACEVRALHFSPPLRWVRTIACSLRSIPLRRSTAAVRAAHVVVASAGWLVAWGRGVALHA